MKELYFEIQMSWKNMSRKESIKFFIEKDEIFGLNVSKYENEEPIDVHEFKNISNQKKTIEKIVDFIVNQNFELSQIEYFIDDFLLKEKESA